MFNLFSVAIKQTGIYVHVTGVSYYDLSKDIEKYYSSSLITKHQLRRETWDTLKVHNFFLIELHKILEILLKIKTLRSRRKALSDLKLLIETETWFKDTITPEGPAFDFKRLDAFTAKPFIKQQEFLEQYPIIKEAYHLKGLMLDSKAGSGKAMPLSTRVKTPTGWKALGDLVEGDILLTPRGKLTTVTGIHRQGITDVYRFHFEDGRFADSHPEHLWQVDEVSLVNGESHVSPNHVTTTQDIVDHFPMWEYQIPLVGKIEGQLSNEGFASIEVAEMLLSGSAPIGDPVLELSYTERFNIAKSMITRSGCQIAPTGVAFITTTEQAATNFQSLIWSLGGIAEKTTLNENSFRIDIYHHDIIALVEELQGPGLVLEEVLDLTAYQGLRLQIKGIEKRPQEETLCITVDDAEHLFVVDNYIVTHNTFTAIMWSHLLGDGKTVVIAPLNIIDEVWIKELSIKYKVPPRVWSSKMGLPLTENYDWYLVHYDALVGPRFDYLRNWLKDTVVKSKKKFKLILDESHNFNEVKAKQTQNLITLADMELFSDALPMSGTALKAQGSEIFPTLCIIDLFFDKVAREFFNASYGRNRPALNELLANRIGRSKFTIPEITGMGPPPPVEFIKVTIPGGEKYTLDAIRLEMQEYFHERMAFYDKHMPAYTDFFYEVIQDYEYSIQKNPREMEELLKYKQIVNRFRTKGYNSFKDSQDSQFCKRVEENIEKDLKGKDLSSFRNIKSAVKYLGLKLRGEALGNVLGKARINAIKETIQYANLEKYIDNVEKKTVIFTSYIEALQLCEQYLVSKGYSPVTVYGENSHLRDSVIRLFGEDPKTNPLIAVIDSLKEGYPLLMANQEILLNAPWRNYELEQLIARIWRRGQESPCFIWMVDMDTGNKLNISSRSINIMEWSREQVDTLLGQRQEQALWAVTGEEMFDMSDEPNSLPLNRSNSLLSIF